MARPSTSICCSPPLSVPGVLAGYARDSTGKHGKDAIHAPADFCRIAAGLEPAELEIFAHGQERKDVPAFRHQRDAELAALVRGSRRHVLPAKTMIVPRRGGSTPAIARSVVDLPAPLAPISATISPSVEPQ